MYKLEDSFYSQQDVVNLAKQLLGKVLCTRINGDYTTGIICETEAYAGELDKASHAYGGRRTARTEVMYGKGGIAYVYLCYGIHHLFNVVSNVADVPHAILIRGIVPLDGKKIMLKRRGTNQLSKNSFIGPAKVSQALGIGISHNELSLQGDKIWIEDRGIAISPKKVITGPRIGIDYAEEDAQLPYRFQYEFNR